MTTNPVPVEPCAVWRMLTTGPALMKAEQQQNIALRDVDPKLIADPVIQWKPKGAT